MEKKKNTKKILSLILLILGLVSIGAGVFLLLGKSDNEKKDDSGQEVVKKPDLKDDFYESVNYDTLLNAKIPADSSVWSHMYDVQKTIEKRQEELTNEILADPNYKNEDIDNLLELLHDYEGRNKRGFDELKPYFEMIDNVKTLEDFNKLMFKLDEDFGVSLLINAGMTLDLEDATKKIIYFNQIDNFELYTNDKYTRYRDLSKKSVYKIMSSIGYDEEKSNDVYNKYVEFGKKIQAKSVKMSEVNDITKLWKKYTLEQITNEIKNLPFKQFLDYFGVGNEKEYVVLDLDHYKAVDEAYTEENLQLFKDIYKVRIAAEVMSFTTEENEKFMLDIENEESGASKTLEKEREELELNLKTSFISDEIQKRYEKKYFTDEDKKILADLVDEIKTNYKEGITNSTWLSQETKTKAIKKLDTMKVNIGYQESKKDKDYYKPIPKSEGGTIIKYLIEDNKYDLKKALSEFHEKADIESFSTLIVNASYQPQNNSINFYAGWKGLYENETDYYKKLGYFGTVIAHEISHAFDNYGSKFDENGKLIDWWTKEDRESYEKLAKKIEDYYSKYEIEGFKVDGHKTVGENIADLAGVKSIISILEKRGATKEEYKKFFEAYADLWAEKTTKEGLETQILSDTHSPNKIRVNAVLSSMDKFYEVYDIKEGDKMFVPKEERVGLW